MGTSNFTGLSPLAIDSFFSSDFFFKQQVPELEQQGVEASEWECFLSLSAQPPQCAQAEITDVRRNNGINIFFINYLIMRVIISFYKLLL